MDDEEKDGCTIIVPGFHRKVREWWKEVESRGQDKNEFIHLVRDTYKEREEDKYGK